MDIFNITRRLKRMYKVNDVSTGFSYWFFKLLNILQNMFVYKGLPESLPAREIELNLLLTGHAAIVPMKDGGLFTPITSISGHGQSLPTLL